MGGCLSPFNAFQLIQGLETLALRGKAHSDNANELAKWLVEHPKVKAVSHPSLTSHPSHERAKKYFRKGCFGSVLTFEITGADAAASSRTARRSSTASRWRRTSPTSATRARSSSTRPRRRTSSSRDAEQVAAGVQPSMVRVSVGYEDIEDIKADFDQALAKCS